MVVLSRMYWALLFLFFVSSIQVYADNIDQISESGFQKLFSEDYIGALNDFNEIFEMNMAGPEHYFGKSIALLKSGNISEGKTLIENMPRPSANSQNINNKADNNSQNNLSNQQRNDNFSGKISYGEIDRCIQSGDISHALILLQKLLSDDSYERITIVTDVDELVKAGNQAQQNNDFEGALEFFNQAITNGSSRPDVYAGMGFALDSMGQYENATEYFNKALEVDPNFKPAIERLKRINENIENDNPNGNMSLINELVEKGNKAQTENYPDLALSYFLQALDTGIIRPDVYTGMGFALESLEQYDNATEYLNKALDADPDFKPAIEGLKRINENIEMENLNENISQYEEYVEKGNKEHLKGNWKEAFDYYTMALDGGIIRSDVYQGLGMTFKAIGQYENATFYFNKALALKPTAEHSKNALEQMKDNTEKGIIGFKIPDINNYNMTLYEEYVEKGMEEHLKRNWKEAFDYYTMALDCGIIGSDVYQGLGMTFKAIGQYENATLYFNKALALKPTAEHSKNALEQMKDNTEKGIIGFKIPDINNYNMTLYEEYVEKGNNAQAARKFNESLEYYFKALDSGVIGYTVYGGIGLAYKNLGQYENATYYLNEALKWKSTYTSAINALKVMNEEKEKDHYINNSTPEMNNGSIPKSGY